MFDYLVDAQTKPFQDRQQPKQKYARSNSQRSLATQQQGNWKWHGTFIRQKSDWCGVEGQSSVVCGEDGRIIGTLAVAFQRTDWKPIVYARISPRP